MKISSRIVSVLVFVGIIFIGLNCFYYLRVSKIRNLINSQIPTIISSIENSSKLDSRAQLIRYYDEVLTQSARNYAFTADNDWKVRYEETAPLLDGTIAQAITEGDDEDKELFSKVDHANKILVDLEQKAIADVEIGRKEQAVEILNSSEYWQYKIEYSAALAQYSQKRGINFGDAIATSTESISKITLDINYIITNIFYEVVSLVVVFTILIVVLYFRARKMLLFPLGILKDNAIAVSKGDYSRRINLKSKDEMDELGQTFNKMAEEIKISRANVEQKVVERTKELDREKEKTSAMLQSIGEGVIGVDENASIILVNKAASDMIGYEKKSLLGKKLSQTIKMLDTDEKNVIDQNRPINRVLKSLKQETYTNYFYKTKSGQNIPITLTIAPIIQHDNIIGAINIFRDTSREKQIDKAKTEFVSLASHQLRTPLSAINWYTEMLLAGDTGKIPSEQKKYLEEIYKGNQRMISLINALLNVSRIDLGTFAVKPQLIKITHLTEEIINEVRHEANKKQLKLTADYDHNMSMIKIDPKLFQIIIQNLLSNAIKYTDSKGRVSLKIEKKTPNLLITVADNGCGIPKNQQDQIFTKLFRADNVRAKNTEGTGLGLYIVKSIVEYSGGRVWFESETNKGTKFFVELPLSGMTKKEGTKTLEDIK